MAIVLLIVGLLLGSALGSLGERIELARRRDTANALREIRESLIGFAIAYGRLPCPAYPHLGGSMRDAGIETGSLGHPGERCPIVVGAMPWATLGLRELDSWGRRYTYRVSADFADYRGGAGLEGGSDLDTGFDPCTARTRPEDPRSFLLCSRGDIDVVRETDGFAIAIHIPAVIISHGSNGRGAFLNNGHRLPAGAGDELTNLANRPPVDGSYQVVSRHAPDDQNFDDLVEWVPLPLLLGRMVNAGRLP